MLEHPPETIARRRAHRLLGVVVATLAVMPAVTTAMAQGTVAFEEPLAITEAAAPGSPTGVDWDYDVTLVDGLSSLVARHAESRSNDGYHSTHAKALANSDGPHGFSAEASSLRPSWSMGRPYGRASTAMAFKLHSPAGDGRVKAVLDFSASVAAGTQGLDGEASSASFWLEVGEWALYGQLRGEGDDLKLSALPKLGVPALFGASGIHQRRLGESTSKVQIYANGATIEQQTGTGSIKYKKRIVMNLPADVPYVVYLGVGAYGNGGAYLDPVILPHEDNPDVQVTLYGAHDPTSPRSSFPSADQLTAAGIDVGPFEELGVLDEPEPVCAAGTGMMRSKLAISRVATADSRLRLRGDLALPLDAGFDPVVHGARVRIEDADGQAIIDDVVPGGAFDPATSIGWRHQPAHDRWVYMDPARHGIRRLVVKHLVDAAETHRVTASAYLPESPVPTAASLPLTGTVAFDAGAGQCASATFGDASPGATCPVLDETRLVCRRRAAGE